MFKIKTNVALTVSNPKRSRNAKSTSGRIFIMWKCGSPLGEDAVQPLGLGRRLPQPCVSRPRPLLGPWRLLGPTLSWVAESHGWQPPLLPASLPKLALGGEREPDWGASAAAFAPHPRHRLSVSAPDRASGHAVHPRLPRRSTDAPATRTPRPYPPDCLRGLCRWCGAVSRAPESPQARHMDSTGSYVALRVGDAQRRRKCREKRRGRGKKMLTYTHALETDFGVGLFQFHTKRPAVSGEGF